MICTPQHCFSQYTKSECISLCLLFCSSGTSAAKISKSFLPCKVPRNHCVSFPATSLTISSVRAAYMPPAHLFLDRQCNLPPPCRGRACPARSLMYSSTYLLQPFISTFPCNPRALKMPRTGIFPSGTQNGRHELFSSPMAHQAPAFRKTAIKNTPQLLARYLFGAPSGTRTQDPLIKSQLLYQLS